MVDANPYLPVLHRNLPRLLGLFLRDQTDPLVGCGDRRYWAWKLVDFPNATYQGAAYGLALMLRHDLLPDTIDKLSMVSRICEMIRVVPKLADSNGGLAEALPNEGSFCVTGLVLADCLGALEVLGDDLSDQGRQALIKCLAPQAHFLSIQDETHGLISNHLATSALGLVRWHKITGEPTSLQRAATLIDRIQDHASEEGWLSEYGGADPGYQSWCTSALAQIHKIAPDLDLLPLIRSSFEFLECFARPDGSFANGCGARLTRFFFRAGAELMENDSEAAARLASFGRRHLASGDHVGLDSVDEPNLIPFFNDLALAAANWSPSPESPLRHKSCDFPKAGLSLVKSETHLMTISVSRGGWFDRQPLDGSTDKQLVAEPVARDDAGQVYCARNGCVLQRDDRQIVIEAEMQATRRRLPTPGQFVILRLLSLSFFRSPKLGNKIKEALARVIMGTKPQFGYKVTRTIDLKTGDYSDVLDGSTLTLESETEGFSPLHMASQGYWQVSDDSST